MLNFRLFNCMGSYIMRKVFIILLAALCAFGYSQQVSLYSADKVGIGLNGDKTFSPEFIFKAEKHSFFAQYWMYYPSLGCKIRYYKAPRAYVYSGVYASAVFAHNTETGEWMYHVSPDVHICGFEIYPFSRDYLGVSIYLRSFNFESYRAHSALMIKF